MARIFTAAVLSVLVAASGAAFAQGSGTGTPNTLHGSGNMMQDGPHASSANPYAAATTALPAEQASQESAKQVCERRWHEAQTNGTAVGLSHVDFISACRSSL